MSALTNPQQPPTKGLVAGKYQLNRLIGKGGMGSVWEGQHFKLGTKVAIKFIETEHAVSAEARSRFEKEAMAAATIQSKHAIQIFDHGVTDEGIPYIVMELLQGESLERRVERLSRMSLQDTARTILQVCRALSRAHERGIIHRDLKPDNVFIVRDADDGEEIAKVLDFGIAKMQGAPGNPGMTSSTKTGAVLGTPFYMSPEQARGLRNVDHRTDVWSLGVIAFRCVTGKLPFDGESVGDLLVKICTAPVPVPSQVVAGIPPGFDQWFMRSMEREPDRRFPGVMEQANELCYIAGIAQAGPGSVVSQQQTVGVANPQAALMTPNGMMRSGGAYSSGQPMNAQAASGFGQPPMTQPSPGSHPSYPSNPGYSSMPGNVTNSPFTSENVAGLPKKGGVGKIIAGVVAGVVVLGAVVVGGIYIGRREQKQADSTSAAISATPPSPASSTLPDPKPAETKPDTSTSSKPPETKPDTTTAAVDPKPAPRPVSGTKPATHPVAAPKPAPAPAPSPAPAPAAAPTKQPNKNDPGY